MELLTSDAFHEKGSIYEQIWHSILEHLIVKNV